MGRDTVDNASTERPSSRSPALGQALFIAASLVNVLLLWHFHDRYWYPSDDGFYSNIAERLMSGEVLNRDIQDVHPGYIHFLHALAFRVFGTDMVSLRYPLIAAAFIQGCVGFALLQRRDAALAALGAVAMTALGVIQFVDPTPNWYCLTLSVILAFWMIHVPPSRPVRLVGAGFLIGMATLLRQPSGVSMAMAVLVLALVEHSAEDRRGSLLLGRVLLGLMLAAIISYLAFSRETEAGGVVLIAAWPIAILFWALFNVRVTNADVLVILARLAVGGAVTAAPLVLYHVAHGSIIWWIDDNILVAARATTMAFFGNGWYGVLPLAGLFQVVSSTDPIKIANGLYWMVLPLLSAVNGALILKRLVRHRSVSDLGLPVIASFYALVSLYFEGPLYLYFSAGLSLLAILWFAASGLPVTRFTSGAAAGALALVAVVFHAGQPPQRTPLEILRGARLSVPSAGLGLKRCSLRLSDADRETYAHLVSVIQRETSPDEFILAIPNDAELYFLATRRNPVRFYNSALGIQSDEDLRAVMQQLARRRPRIVIFRPEDKWNTAASLAVMARVRAEYAQIGSFAGTEIYRLQ